MLFSIVLSFEFLPQRQQDAVCGLYVFGRETFRERIGARVIGADRCVVGPLTFLCQHDQMRPAMVWIGLELDQAIFCQIVDDALDVLAVRAEIAGKPGHGLRPEEGSMNVSGFSTRLVALSRKETRQMLRDRSNLVVGLLLPVVLVLLFGYGLSFDVTNARVTVVLEDRSPTARNIVSGLHGSPYFAPRWVTSMAEAERMARAGQTDAILRLPGDFSRSFAAGDGQLQLLLNGVDASTASAIEGYVSGALTVPLQRQADRAGNKPSGIDLVRRVYLEGATFSDVALNFVPLLLVAAGCLAVQGQAVLGSGPPTRAAKPRIRRTLPASTVRRLCQGEWLAGALGFEPRYVGTKNRCLTTWRRPNSGRFISKPSARRKSKRRVLH